MAPSPSPAEIASRLGGGSVSAVAASPLGEATAFVWSKRRFPPWYRVGVVDEAGAMALTSPEVRIWGPPSWSPCGALAVGGFVGTRRVVFEVDAFTAATRAIAGAPDASYQLVEHERAGVAICRRRSIDGAIDLVRVDRGTYEVLTRERKGLPGWEDARVVNWQSAGLDLEGILVPPTTGEPPWPAMVFLHGGPVGSLAVGEVEQVAAWADPRRATFIPEFPASGICGEAAMLAAFEAVELPEHDHEVDSVLAGIDAVVEAGLVDGQRLFVVGHSYGAYLLNRALTRTDRFRAAVCWEGVADLRLLHEPSLAAQATWRGGAPHETPGRWSATSPIDRAERVGTPTLLYYGADSRLVHQGQLWHQALRGAGVRTELVVEDRVGHTLVDDDISWRFHERVGRWFDEH